MNMNTIEKITCVTTDKESYNGQPLYKALLNIAKKSNVLQASAIKGIEMVSSASNSVQSNAFQNATLPVFVQVVGTTEDNELFLKKVAPIIEGHVIMKEQIQMAVVN